MNGRTLWYALSLIVIVAMLSACVQPAPAPAPAPAAPQATEAPKAAAPAAPAAPAAKALPADAAKEQVLRIATGSSGSASFDFFPMRGGSDNETWMPLLYMPPMYFDEAFKELKPGVFISWESNKEFTVWTFKLDPKAKFSDNSPITAQETKLTWEIMTNPKLDPPHGRIASYISNVKGFQDLRDGKATEMAGLKAVDDRTLEVTLDKPDPLFAFRIGTTHMNPIKASQAKANLKEFWLPANKPVFSGPYMLSAFNPDTKEATFVKNPNWWKDEGPYLDKIEFKFVPDAETIATMFQNNQIDVALTSVSLALKPKYPDLFRPVKAIGFNMFWIRPGAEPTDDVNVRKALVLAVNHEEMMKAAFPEGDYNKTTQFIDPDLPCKATESFFQYNVEEAKKALAASKYGSADKLPKLRVTPRGNWPPMNRALEYAMESWRKNLGITNIEFKQQTSEWGPDQRKLNISRDDVVVRFPDSATYLRVGIHSQGEFVKDSGDEAGPMFLGYKNAKVDQLIDQALLLPVTDPKRCELALEVQKLFMADYGVLPFGKTIAYLSARDYVKNYIKGPDRGLIEPWKIYLAAKK
jgi:peptide/nickel transport system substrate-binding protein